MPSSRRDAFPDEVQLALARVDEVTDWSRNYQPVLPAAETPQQLIAAAIELDAQLASHPGLPETDAIENEMRKHITAVLARSVTQPVELNYNRIIDVEMHLDDYPTLRTARSRFITLLESAKPYKSRDGDWLHELALRKKAVAKKHGIELDLTRDEWAAL